MNLGGPSTMLSSISGLKGLSLSRRVRTTDHINYGTLPLIPPFIPMQRMKLEMIVLYANLSIDTAVGLW